MTWQLNTPGRMPGPPVSQIHHQRSRDRFLIERPQLLK
jgi:hypothetical protein